MVFHIERGDLLDWPFKLDEDWRLITYSILPVIQLPGTSNQNSTVGLGDADFSLFVTPSKPGVVIWGLGPTVMLPTRTDPALGSDRVGLGSAAVLFYEQKKWSTGVVLQNVWSLGGSGVNEVNTFSAQYILNYNLPYGWYLYSNSTLTSDWTSPPGDRWTVPAGGGFGKIFSIGKQSAGIAVQAFSNVVRPDNGPSWYLNLQFSLLFP